MLARVLTKALLVRATMLTPLPQAESLAIALLVAALLVAVLLVAALLAAAALLMAVVALVPLISGRFPCNPLYMVLVLLVSRS